MAAQANYEKSVFAKTSRTNARGEGERGGAHQQQQTQRCRLQARCCGWCLSLRLCRWLANMAPLPASHPPLPPSS